MHVPFKWFARSYASIFIALGAGVFFLWDLREAAFKNIRTQFKEFLAPTPATGKQKKDLNDGITRQAAIAMWVFVLILLVGFFPLWSSRFLYPREDGSVRSGGSAWADLPIHMHIAESFLKGRNQYISFFNLHSPIFAATPMSYPFIPDFHSAVLVKLGFTMRWGLLLPSFCMFLALMGLAFALAFRISRSSAASIVGCTLVILSGGIGGINWLAKGSSYQEIMNHDPMQDDPVRGNGSVFWFAFLPHVIIPQRAACYGYPVAVLATLLLWVGLKPQSTIKLDARRRLLIVVAAICAMLPLVHAHSFVCMAVIVGTIFALEAHAYIADPMQLTAWIPAGIVCILLFLPQYIAINKVEDEGVGKHEIELISLIRGHDNGFMAETLGKVGLGFVAKQMP